MDLKACVHNFFEKGNVHGPFLYFRLPDAYEIMTKQ